MEVARWAEIRRLSEVEKLSGRAIAERLGCSRRTVARALCMQQAPVPGQRPPQASRLDPYKPKIKTIIAQYPNLSAVRILEKISMDDDMMPGYAGRITVLRNYLRTIRPSSGRVYQDIVYSPGEAIQIDWGDVGSIKMGTTLRRISVFVSVLCYSRMLYIEFTLSQRKAEFYRCLNNSLLFFGGSPRKVIFDNLKAAVISGSGRHAVLHPEFLALCGHYCLEPIACTARDPESKGMVESQVGYVKRNALQGRDDELQRWDDYRYLATQWRDYVANVRLHDRLKERPIDRFKREQTALRSLPSVAYNTDELVMTQVRPVARVDFDSNRYTVPPRLARKTVVIRADATHVRIEHQGEQVACHERSYGRRELVVDEAHQAEATSMRRRRTANQMVDRFRALGEVAIEFLCVLERQPRRSSARHLKRILELAELYGHASVLAAMRVAITYQTCDAAYVESIVQQHRRQQSLPCPTPLQPKRAELMELELDAPDPSKYDRFTIDDQT